MTAACIQLLPIGTVELISASNPRRRCPASARNFATPCT